MRVALFSDIHGHVTGLKAVLARLDRLGGADICYALGDFIGGGPGLADVLDLLLARQISMIRGNWDEVFMDVEAHLKHIPPEHHTDVLRTYEWSSSRLSKEYHTLLANLPLCTTVQLAPQQTMLLCHAAPDNPWADVCQTTTPLMTLRATFGKQPAQIVAYGHYHAHHVLKMDNTLLINVASVGLGWHGLSAMTLLEYRNEQLSVQQYQVPYDIHDHDRLVGERQMPDSPAIWYWKE